MALTAEQLRMCTRPNSFTSDALEKAGHKTLKHHGVKGMKWNKDKKHSLADQGQTGDARVNGVEHDKEVIAKLNKWIAAEKDPKKVEEMKKSLALYKLDLTASTKLEKYNREKDPKKKAKLEKQINALSPNILKNNHYDASKDKMRKKK